VEVCEGTITTNESDMGISHANAIFALCSTRGNNLITMEGSQHIGFRNAKVRALPAASSQPAELYRSGDIY
jgi:hypothetical protein